MSLFQHAARLSRGIPDSRTKVRAGRALAALCGRLGIDPIAAVALRDGSMLILDPRGRTEGGPFWNGVYEPGFVRLISVCARAIGPSIYDIGANVGLVAIPLARELADLNGLAIQAFEPVPSNAERLSRSIQLNKLDSTIFVHQLALGAAEGALQLAAESGWGASTGNAVPTAAATKRSYVIEVPIQPIDSLLGDIPPPDILKIDAEGQDVFVLEGARQTIEKFRPVIFGEFNNEMMPKLGISFTQADEQLSPLGYKYFSLDVDRLHAVPANPRLGNVVCIPDEKIGLMPAPVFHK